MNQVLERLGHFGLVPVIEIDDAQSAAPLADALVEAGLPVAEITFRTDAAEEALRAMAKARPDVLLGAGTVLTVDQVKAAVDAGAQFIVTPGFNRRVVEYCVQNGVTVTPGINNPTGVEMALEAGLDVVKFFPAEASGGTRFLKAMVGPYGWKMRYIPTGGINAKNLGEYLAIRQVLACGGSWMVPRESLREGRFEEIRNLVSEAVALVKSLRSSQQK